MLETKSKFNITSPEKERPFVPEQFYLWTNNNMFRTSYNDMSIKSPVQNKNVAIPKYAGYVPGMVANNQIGSTYTQITRNTFTKDKLDNGPHLFSTTGFNWKNIPNYDETQSAWTHKYGKQTLQKPHPAINDHQWTTIARRSFQKPNVLPRPTLRHSGSHQVIRFDNGMKDSYRKKTIASGFNKNALTGDGKTLVPEPILHSDMIRTEYRMRYNQEKPFQKVSLRQSMAQLPRRKLVYDEQ